MGEDVGERGQRGVNRILRKLDDCMIANNFYEAHQMYRTLYFRFTAQRKYDECLKILYDGATKLIALKQEASGADLGLLLIETLEKHCNDVEDWINKIITLIKRMSPTVERETLINRAVKWSSNWCEFEPGHPRLHAQIAELLWKEDNYEQARHHYLLSGDGYLVGHMLTKISQTKGYSGEVDLFIAQAVLQLLVHHDIITAKGAFYLYTAHHPKINRKKGPFKQPLLNFLELLFDCIVWDRVNAFRTLCELYKPSLSRDPSLEKYLHKIGFKTFRITPPASSSGGGLMGGVLGDLFSRLIQGFDEDEENPEQRSATENRRDAANATELD